MTVPLAVLAVFAVLAGFLGTPAWPWFHSYLNGEDTPFSPASLFSRSQLSLTLLSALIVGAAFLAGWKIYSNVASKSPRESDPLENSLPALFRLLHNKFFIDEFYAATFIRLNSAFAFCADWLDRVIWAGAVNALSAFTLLCARLNRSLDDLGLNVCFDFGCDGLRGTGGLLSCLQNGRVQRYLRIVGLAFSLLVLALLWVFS
jgi:NADH-quinone oxidoreductase subunit L